MIELDSSISHMGTKNISIIKWVIKVAEFMLWNPNASPSSQEQKF